MSNSNFKVLHTSDWHLGHRLYNNERTDEFELFFDFLIEQIKQNQINALIVSGDIFDTAYPSSTALKQYYNAIMRIKQAGCEYILIAAGNHDAPGTLLAPKELLEAMNVFVCGTLSEFTPTDVIELKDKTGAVRAAICLIPYLRDRDMRKSVAGESFDDRVKALQQGIAQIYAKAAEHTQKYVQAGIPVIATGHLFAVGAKVSDSERTIQVGNLADIDAKSFGNSFAYVALGHLHRPQKVAENPFIRYSGSPIALSFSEKADEKSMCLVSFAQGTVPEVSQIAIPQFRKLVCLSYAETEFELNLRNYANAGRLTDWAELEIHAKMYTSALKELVSTLVAQLKSPQILKYKIVLSETEKRNFEPAESKALKDFKEIEVFDKLLQNKQISETADLIASFNELLTMVTEPGKE